jgi:aminopeptidase-like protein
MLESSNLDALPLGNAILSLATELYPICRSITGNGVRQTLRRLERHLPLAVHEVPTGTRVFDWTVPQEWNVRDAYVKNSRGERVIDFQACNLSVMNYSVPFHGRLSLDELKPHLHTAAGAPDWIPYRTTYYSQSWGFCLPASRLLALEDDIYEVVIESSLTEGFLTYAECLIPGQTEEEILISSHICHPSLANDNLSGVGVAVYLARLILASKPHFSYRFLFIPGTIGSIAWLSRNRETVERIRAGIVLACVGDAAPLTYKRSRRGDAPIDRAFSFLLAQAGHADRIRDFSPYGYDERQYCSPGFNLPVGVLMRSPFGEFPEYHTSADNLEFLRPASLGDAVVACLKAFEILENDRTYFSLNPMCEPQLGRRGLYRSMGGPSPGEENMATLWVLNQSDGRHSLLEIAERARLPFASILGAARKLERHGLLRCASDLPGPDEETHAAAGVACEPAITR